MRSPPFDQRLHDRVHLALSRSGMDILLHLFCTIEMAIIITRWCCCRCHQRSNSDPIRSMTSMKPVKTSYKLSLFQNFATKWIHCPHATNQVNNERVGVNIYFCSKFLHKSHIKHWWVANRKLLRSLSYFMGWFCPSVCLSVGRITGESIKIIKICLRHHIYDPGGKLLLTFGVTRANPPRGQGGCGRGYNEICLLLDEIQWN